MAITAKIKKRKNSSKLKKLAKHLESLRNLNIKTGYFTDSGTHSTANVPYAELAFWHEYGKSGSGGESQKYPARFLFTISASIMNKSLTSSFGRDIKEIITNSNNKRSLIRLAMGMTSEIDSTFGDPILGANSPETIRRKGHDSPMIDTGELQDNLGYKINNEGVNK